MCQIQTKMWENMQAKYPMASIMSLSSLRLPHKFTTKMNRYSCFISASHTVRNTHINIAYVTNRVYSVKNSLKVISYTIIDTESISASEQARDVHLVWTRNDQFDRSLRENCLHNRLDRLEQYGRPIYPVEEDLGACDKSNRSNASRAKRCQYAIFFAIDLQSTSRVIITP